MRLRLKKKRLYNLFLAISSVILFLIILEFALRLGSVFYAEDRVSKPDSKDGFIILAIGDSHTYGLGVEKYETYPSIVEGLLNRYSENGYKVINLAQAGINSAKIKKSMQRYIDLYKPDLVLLMIGVNNGWNMDGVNFESMQAHRLSTMLRNFLYNFRTYRLYRLMVHYLFGQEELAVKTQPNLLGNTGYTMIESPKGILVDYSNPKDSPIDSDDAKQVLEQDLVEINNILEQNKVQLVMMTYPIPFDPTSDVIRKVAKKDSILLVDNERYFRKITETSKGEYYIDLSRHLDKKGYEIMSGFIYSKLVEYGLV